MDTTETYKKMCDHPIIQEKWRPDSEVKSVFAFKTMDGTSLDRIWLPRQDDIQGMMEFEDIGHLMNELMYFWQKDEIELIEKDVLYCGHNLTSMEQLWLAFYMHEKHKLKWSGDKWEKEK